MSQLKKAFSVVLTVCLILSIGTYANAASLDEDQKSQYEIITVETNEISITSPSKMAVCEPKICRTQDDYEDYILYGEKNFVFSPDTISVEELLKKSTNIQTLRNGNQTGTFQSPKMDTGTPFVKWYYTVDYEIEPFSNGYGWRFKSVQGHIFIQKGILLYTWANTCIVTVESATHSLNAARTAVTINVGLKFDVTTDAFLGVVTYRENHSHTTSISNLAPY